MMPLYEHENWGDVQDHIYMKGVITSVDEANDVADVTVPGGQDGSSVPLFYHCSDEARERVNGAIEGAAMAFTVDDDVIVMCAIHGAPVRVVGFVDGIRMCQNYILLLRAGHRLVAWDLKENKFARIPKSDYDDEAGMDVYTGEYVQKSDWPLESLATIGKWYNESTVAEGSENLFDMEWIKSPNLCPVDDITDYADDGSEDCTIVSHLEWRESARESGSSDWPFTDAPDSATQFVRTWNTIFGVSTHTISGTYRLHKWEDPGDSPARFKKQLLEDTEAYSLIEWSGVRFTCLNPAGGTLDFTRRLERTGAGSTEFNYGNPWSYVINPWGDDNHHGYDQEYSFSATFTVPIIGAAPVFAIPSVEESEAYEWDCVLNEDAVDLSEQICTPTAPDPTPLEKYLDTDNPKRASVEHMANIACETREPDAAPFEEERVYGYIFGESSQFDPAVILTGSGVYRQDDDSPEGDFMACFFVREKTESLPNCMDFEIFAAALTGPEVGKLSAKSMMHLADNELNDALIEMVNLETQTGEKWRANPYCEVRRGPVLN